MPRKKIVVTAEHMRRAIAETLPKQSTLSDMRLGLGELLKAHIDNQRCDMRSAIRDMMTDLRHLCDEQNVDYYSTTNDAYNVYVEEVVEARAKGVSR
jgi:hypothetical protein